MGFFRDYDSTLVERFSLLLDELCDLLSDYDYDNSIKTEIIRKETEIYEFADEFIPQLLPEFDEFFNYIHHCMRYDEPIDEQEIEDYALNISRRLQQREDYPQFYLDCSDEQSKYIPEVAPGTKIRRKKTEQEYLQQMIMSDQAFDRDEQDQIPTITRADYIAIAKERKQFVVSSIISYLNNHNHPIFISKIRHDVPKATHQLIDIVRKQQNIIDYKDSLFSLAKLEISPEEKNTLNNAVQDSFFITKVLTCEEIYRQLKKNYNALLYKLYITDSYGLFSVLKCLFPNDYVFVRPRIALPGTVITKPLENITRFICGRYKTTMNELKEYIDDTGYDLNTSLSLINKLPDVIMLDRNTLIPKSKLSISEEQIQAITSLIAEELNETPGCNETLALRDLTCVIHFPPLGMPLNEWILYSILTKWTWPGQNKDQALFTFATSPYLSRNIPIVSTHETISKEIRQIIAKAHEGQNDSTLSVDDLSNLDELIEDEIEFDWDLEALEEEEENA